MSSIIHQLFTERFRPNTFEQAILLPRVREELSKGLIQNILLHSVSPGTGKTSSSRILSKNYITKYIDATTDGKVGVIESIDKFCSTISLEGGKDSVKCVVLEELTGASREFFMALLPLIEKHSKTTRFIGSINYINLLPEPLLSRFNCISFDPINNEEETYIFNEYVKRLGTILTAAKITYTPEILNKFIKNKFPDMRSLLNNVQSLYIRGVKELNDKNFNINYDFVDLYNICVSKSDPVENYKLISSEYSSKIDDAMSALGSDFINFIKENCPEKINKIPLIIIAVAEHQYQVNFVIDRLVTMLSLVFKIQLIINS